MRQTGNSPRLEARHDRRKYSVVSILRAPQQDNPTLANTLNIKSFFQSETLSGTAPNHNLTMNVGKAILFDWLRGNTGAVVRARSDCCVAALHYSQLTIPGFPSVW
jgi:hypothetical protein